MSTLRPPQEGTSARQVRSLQPDSHQQGWSLLPDQASREEGRRGARLDRPALARLRDGAQRGEGDAGVVWSPDRLARTSAHPWRLEECTTRHAPVLLRQQPFGDTPQGKRLPQLQGLLAEDARAQMLARPRRGRLEQARRGDVIPWADRGEGDRDRPTREGSPPQVPSEPGAADVGRRLSRMVVEAHRRGRHLTTHLHASPTPPPSGLNQVGPPATVRPLLTTRVSAGPARDTSRQPATPRDRTRAVAPRHARNTGRRDRPEREGVGSAAAAMLSAEWFDNARGPGQRNAVLAHTR